MREKQPFKHWERRIFLTEDFEIKRKVLIKYNGKSKYPVVPDGVKKIAADAFASAKIDGVSIPESVTEICDNAFIGAHIKEIVIPKTVEHIGYGAFALCEHLRSFTILNPNTTFGSKSAKFIFCACKRLCEVDLPKEMPRATGILSGASKIKSVKLLATETEIEPLAFEGCCSLKEVIIPEGVTKIGCGAFMDCTGLKKIVLPESVEEIGANAFENCQNLKTVVFPKNIKRIGSNAFDYCYSLGARTVGNIEKIQNR